MFYELIFSEKSDLTVIADYYFGKDFYSDALEIYLKIIDTEKSDIELFEKAGYCYQQEQNYAKAIKMYKKSDILAKKTWTTKKLAFCEKRLGNISSALNYYLEAEVDEKENMHTAAMIGQCYLDLGDYDSALKYYFKVEYNDPKNIKVLRPIAWCYFAKGDLDKSKKYYDKLFGTKLSGHDFINIGHLFLCFGDRQAALENYRKALTEGGLNRNEFVEIMEDDEELIVKHNVDNDDLPIIIDHILFEQEDN